MNKIEEARRILEENGQGHIKVENEELADQILHIDFERLKTLDEEITHPCCTCNIEDISPVKAINPDKKDKKELEEYIKIGEDVVKSGHFAIGIMAGGQGTRLGHNGPKGTFKLELNGKTKSLFEIIVDKLRNAHEKYNVYLNCYIMTSPENNKETVAFFEKNNYFNYPKEYIKFFMQEDLPLLNKKGKLILGEDGLIKLASEGNGGIFYSMSKKGVE